MVDRCCQITTAYGDAMQRVIFALNLKPTREVIGLVRQLA
jgi:hypothetical protein